ncbi:hypothetical protein Pelo_10672 [Pelomyxa schiedti]|nr:hypothetical protein Pelo_10672 [Pelomyxa schiedti]
MTRKKGNNRRQCAKSSAPRSPTPAPTPTPTTTAPTPTRTPEPSSSATTTTTSSSASAATSSTTATTTTTSTSTTEPTAVSATLPTATPVAATLAEGAALTASAAPEVTMVSQKFMYTELYAWEFSVPLRVGITVPPDKTEDRQLWEHVAPQIASCLGVAEDEMPPFDRINMVYCVANPSPRRLVPGAPITLKQFDQNNGFVKIEMLEAQRQSDSLSGLLKATHADLHGLQQKNADLQKQYENCSQHFAVKEKQQKDVMSQAMKNNASLKQNQKGYQKELKNSRVQITQQEEAYARLMLDLDKKVAAAIAPLEKEIADLNERVTTLETENADLKSSNTKLHERVTTLETENASLKAKIEHFNVNNLVTAVLAEARTKVALAVDSSSRAEKYLDVWVNLPEACMACWDSLYPDSWVSYGELLRMKTVRNAEYHSLNYADATEVLAETTTSLTPHQKILIQGLLGVLFRDEIEKAKRT